MNDLGWRVALRCNDGLGWDVRWFPTRARMRAFAARMRNNPFLCGWEVNAYNVYGGKA